MWSYLREIFSPAAWADLLAVVWPLLALFVGFFLISLMKRNPSLPAEEGREGDLGGGEDVELSRLRRLPPELFVRALKELLEAYKLEVTEEVSEEAGTVHLVAINPAPITGGRILVECALEPEGGVVEAPAVLSLLDTVRAEQALKGIYATPYTFSAEARVSAEGTQVELLGGAELTQLLKKHAPAWLVEQPGR